MKKHDYRNRTVTLSAPRQSARGRAKLQIYNPATGHLEYESPWERNLLLDRGLDLVGTSTYGFADIFTYLAAGTGTTPTKDDSGAVTASQSGTTVTLSESLATVSAGKLIRWDSGAEAKVVSGSGTSWTVTPSQSVSSDEFTVYRVDQTGLASEILNPGRSNSYLTGAGDCQTTWAGNVKTMKRTFTRAAEVSDQNISEIGFSASSSGSNINIRIVPTSGTVTVAAGKQLRVIFELQVTYTPAVATDITPAVTGWPVEQACTADIDTDRITLTGHGWAVNTPVIFSTTGTLPTGLTAGTTYYIRDVLTDTFKVSESSGGTAIDLSGANGSGHSIRIAACTGHHSIQIAGFGCVNTNGASYAVVSAGLEPASEAVYISVSPCSTALTAFNDTGVNRSSGYYGMAATVAAYTPGSFTRLKHATIAAANGNMKNIRSVSLSWNTDFLYVVLLDYPMIKPDTATLYLGFEFTWGRDLSA